jgi:hypothetical protein
VLTLKINLTSREVFQNHNLLKKVEIIVTKLKNMIITNNKMMILMKMNMIQSMMINMKNIQNNKEIK